MDTDSVYRMQALINASMKNMLNTCYGVPKNLERNSIKAATVTINPIEKVIFNPPATIVFWKNGGKTVVQVRGDDEFNPEIGLAMAISKHYLCDICGLKRYDGIFKKYIPKEDTVITETIDNAPISGLYKQRSDAFYNGIREGLRGTTSNEKKETANDAD